MPSPGAFIVTKLPRDEGRPWPLIDMALIPEYPPPIPEEQEQVRAGVERLQTGLFLIYTDAAKIDKNLEIRLLNYIDQLFYAAKMSLQGQQVYPIQGLKIIDEIRQSVVVHEAGRMKNDYLSRLGNYVLFMTASLTLFAGLLWLWLRDHPLVAMLWLVAASMPGLWVSFAVRKTRFEFEDLITPEQDLLRPLKRICFVGILSVAFALLVISGIVEFKVGSFDPAMWPKDITTALLLGFVFGFNDQILGTRFGQQSQKIMEVRGAA
jgi:hypothetical protein